MARILIFPGKHVVESNRLVLLIVLLSSSFIVLALIVKRHLLDWLDEFFESKSLGVREAVVAVRDVVVACPSSSVSCVG